MTRAQEIRAEVLLQLDGTRELGRPVEKIVKTARNQGDDYTEAEVRDAIYYLKGFGFVEWMEDTATNAKQPRITAQGIKHREDTYAK